MIRLEGQKREAGAPVNENRIKGVLYGGDIKENILFSVNYADFEKVYREAGKSQIISFVIDDSEYEVLIKDFQLDPVKDFFIHIDLYAITRGEETEVSVPFEFVNEAPADKAGLMVNKVMTEITIRSMPRNIPAKIEIDLSTLEKESDAIRLEDINLPEGVSFVTEHLDEVVAAVSAQQSGDEGEEENNDNE